MESYQKKAVEFWKSNMTVEEWDNLVPEAKEALVDYIATQLVRAKLESITPARPTGDSLEDISWRAARRAVSSGASAIKSTATRASSAIQSGGSAVARKAQSGLTAFASQARSAYEASKRHLSNTISWVRDRVKEIGGYLSQLTNIKGLLGRASGYQKKAREEMSKVDTVTAKMISSRDEASAKQASSLSDNLGELKVEFEKRSRQAQEVSRQVGEKEKELKSKLKDIKRKEDEANKAYREKRQIFESSMEGGVDGVYSTRDAHVRTRLEGLEKKGIGGIDNRIDSLPNSQGIHDIVDIMEIGSFWSRIRSVGQSIYNFFKGIYQRVRDAFNRLFEWVKQRLLSVVQRFLPVFGRLKKLVPGLRSKIERNYEGVQVLAKSDDPRAKEFANQQMRKLRDYKSQYNQIKGALDKGEKATDKLSEVGHNGVQGISSVGFVITVTVVGVVTALQIIAIISFIVMMVQMIYQNYRQGKEMEKMLDSDWGDTGDFLGMIGEEYEWEDEPDRDLFDDYDYGWDTPEAPTPRPLPHEPSVPTFDFDWDEPKEYDFGYERKHAESVRDEWGGFEVRDDVPPVREEGEFVLGPPITEGGHQPEFDSWGGMDWDSPSVRPDPVLPYDVEARREGALKQTEDDIFADIVTEDDEYDWSW